MFEFKVNDVVRVLGLKGIHRVKQNDDENTNTEFPLKIGTNTYTKYGQFFSDNGTVFLTLLGRPC